MKWRFKAHQPTTKTNQRGLASIVVVTVLVVILTLISIAFGRLMDRAINNSTNKELSVAADYAAQSGINDAINYIEKNYNPDTTAPEDGVATTNCTDLFGAGKITASLSGADNNVHYTCLTIDPNVPDLEYGGQTPLPAYQSQVIKMTTSNGPVSSLMFSWSGVAGHNSTVPRASGQPLTTESNWVSKGYAPLLRVTLYPVPTTGDLSATESGSSTFFLYPNTGTAGQTITALSYTPSDSMQSVACGNDDPTGDGFNMGADQPDDYTCNVVIKSLPSTGYFYARVTPLYGAADVRINGNTADTPPQVSKFEGVEAKIDSTAKANASTKRLAARVDLSTLTSSGGGGDNIPAGDNLIPEYSVNTATTLCKRLIVGAASVYITDPYCLTQFPITEPQPSVNLCAGSSADPACDPASGSVPTDITAGGTATLHWTLKNVHSCTETWDGNTYSDGSYSFTTGALAAGTYTYTIHNCIDLSNDTVPPDTITFTVNPAGTGGGPIGPSDILPYFQNGTASNSGFTWGLNTVNHGDGDGASQCDLLDNGSQVNNLFGYAGGAGTLSVPPTNYSGSFATGHTLTITCKSVDTGPGGSASAVVGAPPINITVSPSCANNTGGTPTSGCFIVQGSLNGSQQCNDGVHFYIICVSWNVTETNGGSLKILTCSAGPPGAVGSYPQNYAGNPPSGYDPTPGAPAPPVNNWWNVRYGYAAQFSGTQIVTITCADSAGNTGTASIATCFDGSCTGGGSTGGGGGNNPPPPPPPTTHNGAACVSTSTGQVLEYSQCDSSLLTLHIATTQSACYNGSPDSAATLVHLGAC